MKDVDIIISGAQRSGKTTFSRMLARRFQYPVIHIDAVNIAMEEVFPIKGTDQYGVDARNLFAMRLLRHNKFADRYGTRYILEGGVNVRNVRKFFHPEINMVYFLGVTEVTPEEFFDTIRKNDTSYDNTAEMTDEQLREYILGILSANHRNKALCAEYGIPFVETSGDRQAVLASLADEIAARIEEIDREE